MKKFFLLLLLSTAFAGFLPFVACDKHVVDTPMPPPTFTPTNTPVLTNVIISGSLFSAASVTISAGAGVVWTNTDPWVHAINWTNGGTACVSNNPVYVNNGNALTILFPAPGTNYIHCGFHSACGFTPCDTSCEGPGQMAMEVVVQ